MVLFPQNKRVYDFIRKKWVTATPEEIVRQRLLFFMVKNLGYPEESLTVEKKISEIVQGSHIPNRRLDILCFNTQTMRPLLLIECKATAIHERMFTQLIGYNFYIDASFICLANHKTVLLRWKKGETRRGIPNYSELVHVCV